jgi:hypothetical protein
MPTLNGIDYVHLIDGFSKGIDDRSPWIRVVYKINSYDDTNKFANALLGFGTSTGPITGPTVTKGVPHACPLSTNLYANSATVIEGLGSPILNADGFPNWDGGALIQVEYRPPPCNFSGADNPNHNFDPSTPITWATQELDFSTQTFTLPNSKMKFVDTNDPVDVYVKFEIPITIMTLNFAKVPYMPMTAVRNCRGRVNDATFLGSPAETVLMKGAKTTREFNTDGSVVQRVVITFEERDAAHPWNSLPSASSPTFRAVISQTGSVKMYRTADLSQLLNF